MSSHWHWHKIVGSYSGRSGSSNNELITIFSFSTLHGVGICLKAHLIVDAAMWVEKETDASIRLYFAFTSHQHSSHVILSCWPAFVCPPKARSINGNVVVDHGVDSGPQQWNGSNESDQKCAKRTLKSFHGEYFTCDGQRRTICEAYFRAYQYQTHMTTVQWESTFQQSTYTTQLLLGIILGQRTSHTAHTTHYYLRRS